MNPGTEASEILMAIPIDLILLPHEEILMTSFTRAAQIAIGLRTKMALSLVATLPRHLAHPAGGHIAFRVPLLVVHITNRMSALTEPPRLVVLHHLFVGLVDRCLLALPIPACAILEELEIVLPPRLPPTHDVLGIILLRDLGHPAHPSLPV